MEHSDSHQVGGTGGKGFEPAFSVTDPQHNYNYQCVGSEDCEDVTSFNQAAKSE